MNDIDFQAQIAKLRREFPHSLKKILRRTFSETMQRTKKRGLRMAYAEYDIPRDVRKAVKTRLEIRDDGGSVIFSGIVGTPIRHFRSRPKRGLQSWKGVKPRRRKPKGGVKFKIRKGSPWIQPKGPHGESTFWFPTKGEPVLGYRDDALRALEEFRASPIQAIQKRENFDELGEYARETMEKRLKHNIGRLAND